MTSVLPTSDRLRVLHFVTGGFSGATQVAIDLCQAQLAAGRIAPLLVLRRKRHTDMTRVEALRARGLDVRVVPGWAHWATTLALVGLCREWHPDVLMAHGFPEHLIGRRAGQLAGVPRLIQVEHNSRERYTPWSRWRARRLDAISSALVGVSEGVRRALVRNGAPAALTQAIPNGVVLGRFAAADAGAPREAAILMSARFARQKDQPTLIRAMALLRDRCLTPPLYLAGGGSSLWRRRSERIADRLELANVQFLGHVADMPALLMRTRIFVLATHWEGMPLALVEAMAAGCACIATVAPGTEGLLDEGRGLYVPEGDAAALADAIERLLRAPALARQLGDKARAHALAELGVEHMMARYETLLLGTPGVGTPDAALGPP
ncbi:MAG: glycosyltransferase [Paucibacter sp.]|nr:glycosyltransferase [Roseateles sp.]